MRMHQRRTVLLADGDPNRARMMAFRLAALKYEVRHFENGALALLKAHELKPDLIIADADMPILDGCRMVDALRSEGGTAQIPVVLLIESAEQEALVRGWRSGADLCLPWKHSEGELELALRRLLGVGPTQHTWAAEHALAS